MTGRWHAPLDPSCPEVEHAFQIEVEPGVWIDDPYASYVMDDLMEDFERRHSATCERCREYGLENIEIVL